MESSVLAPESSEKLVRDGVTVAAAPKPGVTVTVKLSEAAPRLVTLRFTAPGATPCGSVPKLTETGETVSADASAAEALRRPLPEESTVMGFPFAEVTTFEAVLTSADLICAGVNAGLACFRSAAAPATSGEEKLVPLNEVKPLGSNWTPPAEFLWAAL